MKATVYTSDLFKMWKFLMPIVQHSSASNCLKVTVGDGAVYFTADSAVAVATYMCKGESDGSGESYINAKKAIALIKNLNTDKVTFEIKPSFVVIKTEKGSYKFPSIEDPLVLSSIRGIDNYDSGEFVGDIDSSHFAVLYKMMNHCVSNDPTEYIFQNVFIKDGKIMATDVVKSAVADFDESFDGCLLHKDICNCISKISDIKISIYQSENEIIGKSKDFYFKYALQFGEYPYNAFIDYINKAEKSSKLFTFDPEEMLESINRISSISENQEVFLKSGEKEGDEFFNSVLISTENGSESINVLGHKEFDIKVDSKTFKTCLSKMISNDATFCIGENGLVYILDENMLQMFFVL